MIELAGTPTHRLHAREASSQHTRARAPVSSSGVAFIGVLVVLALEWVTSGIHKLTNDFVGQFPGFIVSSSADRPWIYNDLFVGTVLRAPALFAIGVIVVEIALGAILAASGVVIARRGLAGSPRAALVVLVGATTVSFVFALMLAVVNNVDAPWSLNASPFQSGLAVEYLLAGMSLAMAIGGVAELVARSVPAAESRERDAREYALRQLPQSPVISGDS